MRKFAPALLFILSTLAVTQQLNAQNYAYATGSPSFSTQIPIENGFINVNNGEIHLEIPLATHAQRGRLQLNESLIYDSRIWKIVVNGGSYSFQPTNVPNSMGGWRLSTPMPAAPTAPTYYSTITRYGSCGSGQEQYPTEEQFWNFAWTDPQGTNHAFDAGFYQELPIPCDSNQQPEGGVGHTLDGSGYYMTTAYNPDTQGVDTVVYDRQGNEVYPALQDPNGNYMSADGNGNLVDTLGRTPVLTSTNGNQIYYDILSNGGARLRYTVTTETVNYSTHFSQEAVGDVNGSFTAIQSIQLPDHSSYSFAYDSYGELSSVTFPTGGTVQYSYQNFVDSFNNSNRWLYQRIKDGGTTTFAPATISACTSDTGCQEQTTMTSPDGNDTVYTFTLDSGSISNGSSWNTGITAYQGAAAGGNALKSVSTSYTYGTTPSLLVTGTIYYTVPQTETVTTSLPDVGLTSQTVTTLDSIGANPTNVQTWDYYSGSAPSTPTKQVNYKYGYTVNGASLLTQISVTDGSGTNTASQTNYNYDETTPAATSGLPNHNTVSGPWGNLTSMSNWLNTAPGNPITTAYTVDDSGMVTSVKDPNGNSSSTAYQCSNALPFQATNALSQTTTYTYDCNSGAITNVQDPNDAAAGRSGTAYAYEPVAGRLQSVTHSGFSAGGQTTYSYQSPNETDTAVLATPDPTLTSQDILDSFGRPSQHVQGGSSSETTYDSSGRVYCVTNPHFSTPSPTTDGSTCITSYDGLGRPLTQTQPDNNTLTWSYAGNTVTSTDENQNSWQRTSNAFGQLVSVVEPGSLLTTYSYDVPGNVSTITQNGGTGETARTRSFSYDSLSRLIQAYNPESGWICNGITGGAVPNGSNCTPVYDANGSLKARTDARGITINYQYDALNRLTQKSYSNGDPTAQYVYDILQWPGQPACNASWVAQCNVIGRLSYEQTVDPTTGAIQTSDELSYDAEGRLWLKFQGTSPSCIFCYSTLYRYDLAGNTNQYRRGSYEAGIAPQQLFLGDYIFTYDSAGHIQSIAESTDPNDPISAQTLLFTANQFGPIGLTQATLGNGTSLNFGYNKRGWQNSINSTLSTGGTAHSLGLSFYPNGNVQTVADSINGTWSYTYDPLNRLSSSSSSSQAFQYSYDSFGNRTSQTVTAGSGPQNSYTYKNSHNNRLDPSTGVSYEPNSGNVSWDGFHSYSYDAEGRLSGVDGTISYMYNAEGQRTAVSSGGAIVRQYLYDNVGRPTTVLDANGNLIRSELWAGGTHIGDYIPDGSGGYTNNFILSDHLGNLRAAYDSAENQLETRQSLPYGEEQNASGTDIDPLHFTGLERDQESNLDHAMFRQYSSTMGRWLSPDPYNGSMDPSNPQSFNRYAYVLNSPLNLTDPSGLSPFSCTPPAPSVIDGVATIGACVGTFICGPLCGTVIGTISAGLAVAGEAILGGLFAPQFHGTLKPRPNVDCSQPPPNAPKSPSGANLAQNVQQASTMNGAQWLNKVKPFGDWDYAHTVGQQYAAFGNFNYGATCAAQGLSLIGCQQGAGLAAYGTAARNVSKGGAWTAGPGNIYNPSNANGIPDYGDQSIPSENPSVVNGYNSQIWHQVCHQ